MEDHVTEAITKIAARVEEQPSLAMIAAEVGVSSWHLQRLFRQKTGVSPKRFLQYLTAEAAKTKIQETPSLLEAAWESGLSSASRLHDLMVQIHAVTPGEWKEQGKGVEIRYFWGETAFGEALLGQTERGICWLSFVGDKDREENIAQMQSQWADATFCLGGEAEAAVLKTIFDTPSPKGSFLLHLQGTNFQIRVWEALLRLPPGYAVSYQAIAHLLGRPQASRAVGAAIARNPISYLIPCHRVLKATGEIHRYRWGVGCKKALLAWEWAYNEALQAEALEKALRPSSLE